MENKETPPCGERNASWGCTLDKGHEGAHSAEGTAGKVYCTWPNRVYKDWFQREYNWGVQDARYRAKVLGAFDEGTELKTNVQLTLTDLKTIAYYMAEEEDADPTKAKIDKALKEML